MPSDAPIALVVDDEPINLKRLAEVLDPDFRVRVAASGERALELARRAPYPEVILLDVMMPEMDGYAVCAALKADPLTAAIPVLFITAKTDAESETAALKAGAVDFIYKPINPEVVLARVRVQQELARHRHHLEELVQARTQELAQARDAAESANRAKTAFLHTVSHEMNTPLHHIAGMAYLLRESLPEGRAQEQLSTIDQAGQRLQALVKGLLDFTRLEAGEIRLASEPFDPRAWLGEGAAAQASGARAKGLSLMTEVDSGVPDTLIGDPGRLHQILAQLLDNAVKFSEQGAIQVRMRAGERQGRRLRLEVEVTDQGRGLDAALAARLFQPFQAGDDSVTRQHGGLGLGLALCQRLVQLMSGEIRFTSQPGQGAAVTFSVPLEIGPSVPERA